MEIVLSTFYSKLKEAKTGENVDVSSLSEYLMANLFRPYIKGKDIRLCDLDYDAFELSDMDRLIEYVNDLRGFAVTSERTAKKLYQCDALARTVKSFC